MSSVSRGDRVVVIEGRYKGYHGKVKKDNTRLSFQQESLVELDNGDTVTISDMWLKLEDPIEDVNTELTNLNNQLEKVASGLTKNIQQELITHLGYLKHALDDEKKSRFYQNYNYISAELAIGIEDKTVTEESRANIITSLKRLEDWYFK